MKTLKIWIWVIVPVMILIILLYFMQFNGKLSDDKTDWGTFGDYLSGVFGFFNMVLFAFLTWYIFKSEEERSKKLEAEQEKRNQRDLEFQKDRSDRELEVQRKITLTQFRLQEFGKLEESLKKYTKAQLMPLNKHRAVEFIKEIVYAIFTFQHFQDFLFQINSNSKFQLEALLEILNEVKENFEKSGVSKDYRFDEFLLHRNALIQEIHYFIVEDLKG